MRIGNRTQAFECGTIFNDLERLLTSTSRSRHYLTLNISDTDIVSMEYTRATQGCHFE